MVKYLIFIPCIVVPFGCSSLYSWHRARNGNFHVRAMNGCTSPRLIVRATASLSSRCYLCMFLVVVTTSSEVLRDVLAGLQCIFSWHLSVPPYPILGSSIMLRVINQLATRILFWLRGVRPGLQLTLFSVQTFVRTSREGRCVREWCSPTCFFQSHTVNGFHMMDTVHVYRQCVVAYFYDWNRPALLRL